MSTDLYAALGVERTASAAEITRAYRRLSKRFHPDRNPGDAAAEAKYKEVQAAYEVLGDAERRAKYDETGDTSHTRKRPEEDEFADIAARLLFDVLGPYITRAEDGAGAWFPGHGNPSHSDLVAEMRRRVETDLGGYRQQRKKLERAQTVVELVRGRFGGANGPVLEDALAARAVSVRNELARADEEIARLGRLTEYLGKVTFRREGVKTKEENILGLPPMPHLGGMKVLL